MAKARGSTSVRSALEPYRAKRDFRQSPEPAGSPEPAEERAGAGRAPRFVVQRHRARRLHYDFRLEIGGVLVSWAVPKGPTLDPAARHLAVHVEDHPIEYFDFEGVIPHGEYGGGDVIVWDRGTWEPVGTDDPAAGVAAGELHVDLHGEKLSGRFVLIRRGGGVRGGQSRGQGGRDWLLLHKRDADAVGGWDPEDHPRSVKSGRTNDEVAADPDALWHSDLPAAEAEVAVDSRPTGSRRIDVESAQGANRRSRRIDVESTRRAGESTRSIAAAGESDDAGPTEEELDALDALGAAGRWSLGGRTLSLTNLDKVLFPARRRAKGRPAAPKTTKRDLIRHYATMAPVMLPYLAGRPVNLHRFPDGVDAAGFWHKARPGHAPDWVTGWHYPDARPGETQHYLVADSAATLAWLANYGAVELNPWTSCTDDPRLPTWALVDIDPGPATSFDAVLVLARLFRTALDHLGVVGSAKVTGQRGVQIYVPIEVGPTFEETRTWVERLSRAVGSTVPELVSWRWHKGEREGRARLDYTQNAVNKTLVAPYSARPAAGAPVSVPIEWDELDDPDLRPDRWTIHTVGARLAEHGDPFRTLLEHPQRLPSLAGL